MKSIRLHLLVERPAGEPREWLFDDPKVITVGTRSDASIWLADPLAGPARILFRRKGNRIHFRVSPDLSGSLRIGLQEIPLADLREAGLLRSDRKGSFVVLHAKTSGSLTLGAHLLRFWVTRPPDELEYPADLRPIVLFKSIQPVVTAALLLSFLWHLILFQALSLLPPSAGPDVREVQERYTRFTLPQVTYLKKNLARPTAGETEPTSSPSGKKPLSSRTPGGFLAAVAAPGAKKSSPFARLFATDTLGKSLSEALKGRSLEEAVAAELKSAPASRSPVQGMAEAVSIGSLRQGDLARGEIRARVSGPSVATLSAETAEVEGSIDRGALERVVGENAGQLRDCYERSLERNPALAGKVVVALVVGMDGRPSSIAIADSNIRDSLFRQCVIARVATWLFPKPAGAPTPVRFPFIFSAASRR